jgi:hypothetical protein
MDTTIILLNNLRIGINEIIIQINALENINILKINDLPLHLDIIKCLQHSIENLLDVFIYKIYIQHELKLLLLNTLEIEVNNLNVTLKHCIEWYNNITNSSCFLCYIIKEPATVIEQKLNNSFQKIKPIIKDMIKLQEDILGSAIRIKHPILRKAWINIGGNQLNDNDISSNMLIQSLYIMLKEEENGIIKKEKYCRKMIEDFVNYVDTLAGTEPDSRITINELCEVKITSDNCGSVKGLLGIKKQPDEQIINKIDLFYKPVKINNTFEILEKKFRGYGNNWPSKIACNFIVPDMLNYDLYGINIKCNANDQGFGGTGHAQIRYQINEECYLGFSIWRDKIPDNKYEFTIGPDKVKIGDNINIWVCCPPWASWSVILNNIEVEVIYG